MSWVLPSSVGKTLLGWHGSFVGKKRKKVWRAGSLCIFWVVWKTRSRIAFDDEVLLIQRLKNPFVCFLWSETKMSINDGSLILVSFLIVWALVEGGGVVAPPLL